MTDQEFMFYLNRRRLRRSTRKNCLRSFEPGSNNADNAYRKLCIACTSVWEGVAKFNSSEKCPEPDLRFLVLSFRGKQTNAPDAAEPPQQMWHPEPR